MSSARLVSFLSVPVSEAAFTKCVYNFEVPYNSLGDEHVLPRHSLIVSQHLHKLLTTQLMSEPRLNMARTGKLLDKDRDRSTV